MENTHETQTESNTPSAQSGSGWKKIALACGVIAITAAVFFQFREVLTFNFLADKESSLRAYQAEHPILILAIAFGVYVLVTGLSLPGAAVLTLVLGWFLGFGKGLLLVSFASTTGATIAFLLSRYLLGGTVQEKFADRLEKFNAALEKEGSFYLFTLRLIPAIPFFVINLVMGLTKIKTWTFWWVSQLGMLAGTAVFIYAGSRFPSMADLAENGLKGILSPQLFVAFVLLGFFPITVKKIITRFRKEPTSA